MLDILAVDPSSIAAELGIKPGDRLLAIDTVPVRDLIDYQLHERRTQLLVEIERSDGEVWEIEVEKDADDPLGLVLPHPQPMHCGNNCLFCFVHQLPRGMRSTLYVKDEDYRFSYLYGAYVTLSNIDEAAMERILAQQLSPLYVSVHATEEDLRERLLGRRSPALLPLMQRLVEGGIELHAQVVVCPGINDGVHLERTCNDLLDLSAGVRSLAIVPVGLTGFRDRLPQLRGVSEAEAARLIEWVHTRQQDCLNRLGHRFIFAADELYLRAGAEIPDFADYEDFPQIENGVGLIASFRRQAGEVLEQAQPLDLPPVSIVTGQDAFGEVERFVSRLTDLTGLKASVHSLENRFFGGDVNVTGLLTGQDLLDQLSGMALGHVLLLPDVMLREGEDLLLDDITVVELEKRLNIRVEIFSADPWGLWDILDTLDAEQT